MNTFNRQETEGEDNARAYDEAEEEEAEAHHRRRRIRRI